ncbi:hypothetical protein [Thalassospira lucentensis]|uniref:hypothetical protein n=1 Tax=Thalassospira lucentensis TaxID=168935 RepID=UPI0029424920|nr:hypothetical protein [Thalassospira lucentensis]WOI09425.1 hypothetical protein R1T41_12875 [Thalassospira lucentensis]
MTQHSELISEYEHLQRIVEEFDGKSLTIKTWSVTLSAAGIVTSIIEEKPLVLLVAAASSVVFWLIEALWKANQQAFYGRIKEIEAAFQTGTPIQPFRIATSWSEHWNQNGRSLFAFKIMHWPHISLPHIVVCLSAIAIYLLQI